MVCLSFWVKIKSNIFLMKILWCDLSSLNRNFYHQKNLQTKKIVTCCQWWCHQPNTGENCIKWLHIIYIFITICDLVLEFMRLKHISYKHKSRNWYTILECQNMNFKWQIILIISIMNVYFLMLIYLWKMKILKDWLENVSKEILSECNI